MLYDASCSQGFQHAKNNHIIALAVLFVTASCSNTPSSNPCDGVTCSGHGTCVNNGSSVYCDCEDGYHGIGTSCAENVTDGDADGDGDGDTDSDGDVGECSEGPCCSESGSFLPDTTECDNRIEYRCNGTLCGADAQERAVTQYCSGSSSDCDGSSREGTWATSEMCGFSQVCESDDSGAWCSYCSSGCLGGECLSRRIATSVSHTCFVLDDGNVRCWGYGGVGRLGYGNTNSIGDDEPPSSAGDVDVGGTVIQIAVGYSHTCALLDTGNVRCWGGGPSDIETYYGQLGYGNMEEIGDDEVPSTVGDVDVGSTVLQIATGGFHTCALLDTGNVRCWGYGYFGQLGYGNTENIGDDESPSSAGDVDVGGPVVQIAAGYSHTCALLDTGNVRCWGDGNHGKLGYANEEDIGDDEIPRSVGDVNVGGTVIQIAAGYDHTCALLDTGNVRCWGYGRAGKLGYGNEYDIGDDEPPSSAGDVDVGGTVVQIAAGAHTEVFPNGHTCALLDTGNVRCWGVGGFGQLGYANDENIGDTEHPSSAGDVRIFSTVVQITVGGNHTCVMLDTGNVRCWGERSAALGYQATENIGDDEHPSSVGDVPVF